MDTIRRTVAENVGGMGHNLAKGDERFSLAEVPSLTGKVAVVTGGSEGIGYGCTHTLLSHDIEKLFILSLHREVVDGATAAIREELGDAAAARVHWLQCDLSDWAATARVAARIAAATDRLDVLINNAGRGIMSRQLAGSNGVELTMATNHFGHVVLTSHLLPLLRRTADQGHTVRVVMQASNAHQSAPKDVRFASLDELNREYGPLELYGRSKLAVLLYARYLARHLARDSPRILVNATHPGFVETRQSSEHIFDAYPLGGYGNKYVLAPAKKTLFEGAVSAVYAATAVQGAGQYICPPAIVEMPSKQAQDDELGEQLMKLTREIVDEKTKKDSEDKGCPFKDY